MEYKELKITNCTYINLWLAAFIDKLYTNGYTEQEIAIIFSKIIKSYSASQSITDLSYFKEEENRAKRFFNYLQDSKKILKKDYINKAVKYATQKDTEDFISCFIRYVVKTSMSDVKTCIGIVNDDRIAAESCICTLGEYPLASLDLYELNHLMLFGDVKVNKNIRRLGLGTKLFKDVTKYIQEFFPDTDLSTYSVDKSNQVAIQFYKSLGAEIGEGIINNCHSVTIRLGTEQKPYQKEKAKEMQ